MYRNEHDANVALARENAMRYADQETDELAILLAHRREQEQRAVSDRRNRRFAFE
jgi:hypothetical protein